MVCKPRPKKADLIMDRNPILNNQRYELKPKTMRAFGIEHKVPNRAKYIRMEGRAYYWFVNMPDWIREGENYHWRKNDVEGIDWGRCK